LHSKSKTFTTVNQTKLVHIYHRLANTLYLLYGTGPAP